MNPAYLEWVLVMPLHFVGNFEVTPWCCAVRCISYFHYAVFNQELNNWFYLYRYISNKDSNGRDEASLEQMSAESYGVIVNRSLF
jgi:hypothetical protein